MANGSSADDSTRVRRDTPMLVRARSAGVEDRLRNLPDSPPHGSDADALQRYNDAKHKVQVHNQKIVARAEASLRKPFRV